MSPETISERILAFRVDDDRSDLSFLKRLAIENGWSHEFATEAFEEYKRFLVLCHESGTMVTPSDVVDEVWHLHLSYTRSYWIELCRDTIGRDLHHDPTVGGAAEDAKFREAYEATLKRYERRFGEAPDPKFWPSSDARFQPISNIVKVDRGKSLIVSRRTAGLILLAVGAITLPGCTAGQVSLVILLAFVLVGLIALVRKGGGGGSGGGCGFFAGCGSGGDGGGCGSGGCGGGGCGGS